MPDLQTSPTGDVLRRIGPNLRNPYLCNWDHGVAHALADLLDAHAHAADAQRIAEHLVGLGDGELDKPAGTAAVELSRALLRSFGHTCADTDDPCRQCAARVPTEADVR